MLYMLIFSHEYKNTECTFHIFSSNEKAEKWIEDKYFYKIVPKYKIIEIETLDPTVLEEINTLDLDDF